MTSTARNRALLLGDPGGAAATLLCLPHAGASADVFRPWTDAARSLSAAIWSVDYPGRRSASGRCWTSIHELASQLTEQFLTTPGLVVYGHSMGGIIAYEVAARLRAAANPPARLVVSAAPAPRLRWLAPRTDVTERARALLEAGGTGQVLMADPQFRAFMLQLLADDLTALDEHEPTPAPIDVPLRVLASLTDPVCPPREIIEWAGHSQQFLGYRYYTGGHLFPFAEPERILAECLG